jgi:SPP1 gp7 family putative phage head morphogenesis protein
MGLFKKSVKNEVVNLFSAEEEKKVLATKDRNKIMQFYWDRDLYNFRKYGNKEYKILGANSSKKPACEKCKEMDGKIFNVSDAEPGVNYPPFCEHCRCTTVPVL